ncbi:MAG TPA: HypC/HybG/HupF family hydrogenase formation chaperone [Acidobacteriota bacterium]|nr:HypC/HybG/HupF family hydrogenase formation chaperone [Acidobacteriota bacterium]
MCVAVPMTLLTVSPASPDGARDGIVEIGGLRRKVRLDLIEAPRIGARLLVHAGFAIQQLDDDAADELTALLAEMQAAAEGTGA